MPSDLGLQVKQQRKALNAQESRQLSTCLSHPNTYFCPPLLHRTAVLLALSLRFLFLLSSNWAAPRNLWLGSCGVWCHLPVPLRCGVLGGRRERDRGPPLQLAWECMGLGARHP